MFSDAHNTISETTQFVSILLFEGTLLLIEAQKTLAQLTQVHIENKNSSRRRLNEQRMSGKRWQTRIDVKQMLLW